MSRLLEMCLSCVGLAPRSRYAEFTQVIERLSAEVRSLETRLAALSDAAYAHAPVVRIHHAPPPK